MTVLVPIAGREDRFFRDGYRLPDPLVTVLGMPLFAAALRSVPAADPCVFVVPASFVGRHPFAQQVERHCPGALVVAVDRTPTGQAGACVAAEGVVDQSGELLVSSVDHLVAYGEDAFERLRADPATDAVVFAFRESPNPRRSKDPLARCRMVEDRVAAISVRADASASHPGDLLVAGTFWFRRAADFFRGARALTATDASGDGANGVAASLDLLAREGLAIRVLVVDRYVALADPFDLKLYQAWEEFFFVEREHPYQGWGRSRPPRADAGPGGPPARAGRVR